MRTNVLIGLVLLFVSVQAFAQDPASKNSAAAVSGSNEGYIWQRIDVVSSPAINDLLQRQYDQSRKNSTFPGYRVQLFFGSGTNAHAQAQKIRTEFTNQYPGLKAYLTFKSPDFIIRVGDFRSKSEALKLQKSLKDRYPATFIVADEINFPDLMTQNYIETLQ